MSIDQAVEHPAVLAGLDDRLREVVRHAGVDPQARPDLVREMAEQVVADHDERSLTGAVQPVVDRRAVVSELVARVAGFGPLQPFLDDETVEEIWINDPSRAEVLLPKSWSEPVRITVEERCRRPGTAGHPTDHLNLFQRERWWAKVQCSAVHGRRRRHQLGLER